MNDTTLSSRPPILQAGQYFVAPITLSLIRGYLVKRHPSVCYYSVFDLSLMCSHYSDRELLNSCQILSGW
jgi:hypothetical protein